MKPYKSIFKESNDIIVNSNEEARQIIDISNLEWGDSFKSDWESAQSKCPSGWRVPTIQELYSAYVKKVTGFQFDFYWSSSNYRGLKNNMWYVGFDSGIVNHYYFKPTDYYVRCVREIN